MIFFLLFLLLCLLLHAITRFGLDFASPSIHFIFGWTLCVLIASMYEKEWSLDISFGCFFLIFGGALFSFWGEYYYREKNRSIISSTLTNKDLFINVPQLWKIAVIAIFQLLIYYQVSKYQMAFTMETSLSESIGTLDYDVKFEDVKFKLPPFLNVPNQICQQSGFIWCFLFPYFATKFSKYKWHAILCGLNLMIVMIGSMLSGGRMPIFGYLFPTIIMFVLLSKKRLFSSKKVIKKKLILYISISVLFFSYSFSYIGVMIGRDEKILDNSEYLFAMYCGAEVKNLDDVIKNDKVRKSDLPLGRSFGGFYVNLCERLRLPPPKKLKNYGFNTVNGYNLGNVYSCYDWYFGDLWYFGVLFPFFISYIMCFLYRKIIDSKMLFTGRINLYYCWFAYLSMGTVLSFFSELFFTRWNIESFVRYSIYWSMIIWFLQGTGRMRSVNREAVGKMLYKKIGR